MYLVTIYDGPNDNIGTVIHSPFIDDLKLSKGEINLVVQGISDMSFIINPLNPGWGKINPLKTLIRVDDIKRNKKVFDGRVLKPTQKMSSNGIFSIQYACEGKLAYLNDSRQRHGEYHNTTPKGFLQVIINNHNKQVEPHKRFKLGVVTVTNSIDNVYRYLGYDKTFATIKDKLIDRLGGFLVLRDEEDGMYLDYLESVGEFKDTPIRLRTNLKDMQREIDPLGIITRLLPLGARIESEDETATDASQARLTIETVNDGTDYLNDLELQKEFGIVEGEVIYDDVTQPNILKTRGKQYLAEQKAAKVSYDVTPVDISLIDESFDELECGNWHQIINPVLSIDEPLQIIEQRININDPQKSNLIIGEKYKTLTQYQIETNKAQRQVVELQNQVESQTRTIFNMRTDLITVDNAVSNIQQALEDSDFLGLEDAIENLNQAVDNLIAAVEDILVYEVATPTKDGLMSAVDKKKIDLISVVNPIDLDALVAKVEALENARS